LYNTFLNRSEELLFKNGPIILKVKMNRKNLYHEFRKGLIQPKLKLKIREIRQNR
jgi:hypothetical protein